MKSKKKGIINAIGLLVLFGLLTLTSCQTKLEGTVYTNLDSLANLESAKSLVATCHFISRATIAEYVARYQKWQSASGTAPGSEKFENFSSFNKSIIQAILSVDGCIGLRVVGGMDAQNRFHSILVGVGSNYNTLYIKRSQANCPGDPAPQGMLDSNDAAVHFAGYQGDEEGGAEMGQMP